MEHLTNLHPQSITPDSYDPLDPTGIKAKINNYFYECSLDFNNFGKNKIDFFGNNYSERWTEGEYSPLFSDTKVKVSDIYGKTNKEFGADGILDSFTIRKGDETITGEDRDQNGIWDEIKYTKRNEYGFFEAKYINADEKNDVLYGGTDFDTLELTSSNKETFSYPWYKLGEMTSIDNPDPNTYNKVYTFAHLNGIEINNGSYYDAVIAHSGNKCGSGNNNCYNNGILYYIDQAPDYTNPESLFKSIEGIIRNQDLHPPQG